MHQGGDQIFRAVVRLYLIQLGGFLAVWLGSYYPGLDLLITAVFLFIIGEEAIDYNVSGDKNRPVLIGLIWQLPGLLLSIAIITGLNGCLMGGDYFIFALEFWNTPVIPAVTILSMPFLPHPGYYYLLFAMPFLLSIYYIILSSLSGDTGSGRLNKFI